MSASDIRQQARDLLKNLPGKYQLFGIPLLLAFLNGGISVINNSRLESLSTDSSNAGSFLALLWSPFPILLNILLALFSLAAIYTMLEVVRQQRDRVSYHDLTRTFNGKMILNLFLLYLVKTLLLLPWSLLMVFSYVLLFLGIISVESSEQMAGVGLLLLLLAFIGLIVAVVFLVIKTYSYSQAELVLFDRMAVQESETINFFNVVKESKQLMAGQKFRFFLLNLSFIGWEFLCLLTLGVLAIYVFPYKTTAQVVFYNQLQQKGEK